MLIERQVLLSEVFQHFSANSGVTAFGALENLYEGRWNENSSISFFNRMPKC